jgi:hypothetical protein
MIQLYSQRPDALDCPVFRGSPLQFGAEEWVLPPRNVTLKARDVTDVADHDAPAILERFGRSGVVQVQSDLEDAKRRAKRLRYDFLVKQITDYRNFVGQQQAAGAAFVMPRSQLYEFVTEMEALKADVLANDPVLSAVLPTIDPKPLPDLLGEELAKMGVQVKPPVPAAPALDVGL